MGVPGGSLGARVHDATVAREPPGPMAPPARGSPRISKDFLGFPRISAFDWILVWSSAGFLASGFDF